MGDVDFTDENRQEQKKDKWLMAKKIGARDKKESIKNQLKELISIYSSQNTLCVLSFNAKEEHAIYTSIANTVKQMIDVVSCKIYLKKDNRMLIVGSSDGDLGLPDLR